MDINCKIEVSTNELITKELNWYIKSQLPHILNEGLFEDTNLLNKLIKQAVEGQIRSCCNEVLQGKELRQFIMEKVTKELMGE